MLIFRGVIIDACQPRNLILGQLPEVEVEQPRGHVNHQEQLGSRTAMIYFGGSSQLFEVVVVSVRPGLFRFQMAMTMAL